MKKPFVMFSFGKKEEMEKKINFSYKVFLSNLLKILRHPIVYWKDWEKDFQCDSGCDKASGDEKKWIKTKSTRQSKEENDLTYHTVPNRSRLNWIFNLYEALENI